MRSNDRGVLCAACVVILLGLASAEPVWAETTAVKVQAQAIEQANRLMIEKAIGPDQETPEARKLVERADIKAAFEAYQRIGGLAPKFRFASAYALTSGFTGGALAGLIDAPVPKDGAELLKSHPAAFDLVCEPQYDAASKKTDGDVPALPRTLRFSADVPACLWRSGNAYIQSMHIGERGKLVTKWHIDLEHVTWGAPTYDRASRSYEETVTTTSLASKKPSRTSVHATCTLAPYSKLFGAGEPKPGK